MPAKASAVLLGCRGRMGQRLARDLTCAGYQVHGFDREATAQDVQEAASQARFVILAVPVAATAHATAMVAPGLGPETILLDIASVKTVPLRQMLEATSTPVVGLHPLFGPETAAPLRVAVVPGRGEEAVQAACNLMTDLGYSPFCTSAQDHDQAMAYLQGLNFLTTVAYLCAAPNLDLAPYLTPSFGRRMEAAAKLVGEDAALFTSLVDANPYSLETARRFRAYLNVAASGELELLSRKAESMLWWWRSLNREGP